MLIDNKIRGYPTVIDFIKIVILIFILQISLALISGLFIPLILTANVADYDYFILPIAGVLITCITLFWIKKDLADNKPKQWAIGIRRGSVTWQTIIFIIFGYVLLQFGLSAILNFVDPGGEISLSTPSDSSVEFLSPYSMAWQFVSLISICVLSPIVEEIAFRGYLQTALIRRFPVWFGIVASSLLFSLFHWGFGESFSPSLLVGLSLFFLTGLCFGILFHFSKSLWPPIVLHAINNMLAATTEALDF